MDVVSENPQLFCHGEEIPTASNQLTERIFPAMTPFLIAMAGKSWKIRPIGEGEL
jgi:hypothetical protein